MTPILLSVAISIDSEATNDTRHITFILTTGLILTFLGE